MKKDRLLEIIREEISAALTESETIDLPGDPNKLNPKAKESAIKQARTMSRDMTIGTPKNPVEFVEEEQLNEMAWDIVIAQPDKLSKLQDKLKDSTKKGEQKLAKALEIIQNTKKEGKPIRQRDIANEMGLIQQQINPLINQLIDVGILEKGESVKGVTKKKITDKPQGKPAKAAVAPKVKAAMVPKSEPMDSEDAEAPEGDAEIEKAARGRDELIKQFRDVMSTYKDKKASEGDQAAIEYLKSKQDIVKKYKKIQQVNV
jgi:hypothetical protein